MMPGVSTPLDLNFFNGSEKDLRAWIGLPEVVTQPIDYDLETMVKMLWQAHPELQKEEVKA